MKRFTRFVRRYPSLSTWLGAYIRAQLWMSLLLTYTLVLVILMDVPVSIWVFCITMWCSLAATAVLSYFDNTHFVHRLNHPQQGDDFIPSHHFTATRALNFFLFCVVIVCGTILSIYLSGFSLETLVDLQGDLIGPGSGGADGFTALFESWGKASQDPFVVSSMLGALSVRTLMNKYPVYKDFPVSGDTSTLNA